MHTELKLTAIEDEALRQLWSMECTDAIRCLLKRCDDLRITSGSDGMQLILAEPQRRSPDTIETFAEVDDCAVAAGPDLTQDRVHVDIDAVVTECRFAQGFEIGEAGIAPGGVGQIESLHRLFALAGRKDSDDGG
jgi:hypothetical protein